MTWGRARLNPVRGAESGDCRERLVLSGGRGALDYISKENLARLAPAIHRELENAAHRRARREAEAAARTLSHAVEQAENVIFTTDPEGTITYGNAAFERVYGYPREEALGKTPRMLKSRTQDRAYYERFWQRLCAANPCAKTRGRSFGHAAATVSHAGAALSRVRQTARKEEDGIWRRSRKEE